MDESLTDIQEAIKAPETPQFSYTDELKKKIYDNDLPLSELGGVEKDKIKSLEKSEYLEFLNIAFHTDDLQLIADNIDVISDRFISDVKSSEIHGNQDYYDVHDIGQRTRDIFWSISGRGLEIEPEILERMYNAIHSEDRLQRFHAIENAINVISLDIDNKSADAHIGLFDKYNEDLVDTVSTAEEQEQIEKASWMIEVVWAEYPDLLPELFAQATKKAQTSEQIRNVFSLFANRIGASKAREVIKELARGNPEFAVRQKEVEDALGFNPSTESDLVKLYKKINFEDYKPNIELNQFEANLLEDEFEGKKRLIDVGCGYGRLLHELNKRGKQVVGIDMVFDHVDAVKKQDPMANVAVASWRNTPFSAQSFDGGYILGRSLLHETEPRGMIDTLSELNRVLKPDGTLVIDTPNPNKGHYLKHKKAFAKAAQKLNVEYYEEGSIIDSPDEESFYDRLAPDENQFEAIAFLAGFKAEIIEKKEYVDDEGETNENIYWRLTKLDEAPSFDELMEAMSRTKTGSAPIYFTFI